MARWKFVRNHRAPARRQRLRAEHQGKSPCRSTGLLNRSWRTGSTTASAIRPVFAVADHHRQQSRRDFETLHPKQLRRVVLGPFYSAGITENNSVVNEVLERVRKPKTPGC